MGYGAYAAPVLALTPAGRRAFRAVADTPHPGVALTFDDGPHPEATPRLLDVLDELGVRAAFFLVGEQVVRAPDVAAEVARRGHLVACHGWRHRNHLGRTPWDLRGDLERAGALLEEVSGVAVRYFRPPYGVFSWGSWRACRRLGWRPVLWSRWARDWEAEATPDSIVRGVTEGLKAGEIVLLHDADTYSAPGSHERTIAAVPRIVDYLDRRGLEAVRLDRALAWPTLGATPPE